MELFQPVRNIWNLARFYPRAAITARGLSWLSRYVYRYPRLMLENLGYRQPATRLWPLYYYPPPHFLIGYQYLVRVCNDYVFETRTYSRISYFDTVRIFTQTMNWSVTADCAYSINTGAYHRFVALDNFHETLQQVQQAILAERVVADLALIRPMRGFGLTHITDVGSQVPVERLLHDQYKSLGTCQQEAWGLAERIHIQRSGKKDLIILAAIRRLKNAYFNYLLGSSTVPLSLPCDCCWLSAFVDRFHDEIDHSFLSQQPPGKIIKAVVSSLSLPNPIHQDLFTTSHGLRGGAFELRPRENGRAVTEEMRRRRGEVVTRFIESLPFRRRRQAPPIAAPSSPEPSDGEPEAPVSFEEEVRAAIAEAIRALQDELTVTARNQNFFNFTVHFYDVINRLIAQNNLSEENIRRWVMYFFVCEHLATTLNYLHQTLRQNVRFSRHVELNLAQIVMRARDHEGALIYNRLWTEHGLNAFLGLMQRITIDLAGMVEQAGCEELAQEELDQFMSDIAYHDNSGDVTEILRQMALDDTEIDSIELSFRFKVTGPVAFTQNQHIRDLAQQVIRRASQLRAEYQPLPQPHDNVVL